LLVFDGVEGYRVMVLAPMAEMGNNFVGFVRPERDISR
jgi:hypothetical protein